MKNDERNPVECSIYYLALRKKSVLHGLWKMSNGHVEQGLMVKFLANDFSEEKWQKAALKNAYALLGKQRYGKKNTLSYLIKKEYAVAFFLLGDKLKDAVNVCTKNLNDIQLAIVLCRLYEGEDGPIFTDLINQSLIPLAFKTNDRWLLSISYFMLRKREDAIRASFVPHSR